MNKISKLVSMMMVVSSLAFAQGSSHGDNGGGGEIEFDKYKNEIAIWFNESVQNGTFGKKFDFRRVAPLTPEIVASKLSEALSTAKVSFTSEPLKLSGYSTYVDQRICANSPKTKIIKCNISAWFSVPEYIRYAITLHELLGVAGIESNEQEYSQYPLSVQLLSYLQKGYKIMNDPVSTVVGGFEVELKGFIYQNIYSPGTPVESIPGLHIRADVLATWDSQNVRTNIVFCDYASYPVCNMTKKYRVELANYMNRFGNSYVKVKGTLVRLPFSPTQGSVVQLFITEEPVVLYRYRQVFISTLQKDSGGYFVNYNEFKFRVKTAEQVGRLKAKKIYNHLENSLGKSCNFEFPDFATRVVELYTDPKEVAAKLNCN
jgi:hypothetical protein